MKLTEWADIAEIFGGAAIIASLIFVGLEIQENTRVTILTSDRALDQQNMAINFAVINSADFADILVRGESNRDSLSPADRARFDNYCFSRFGAFENVAANFREGLMNEGEYEVWTTLFEVRFGKPGYRQFWIENRNVFFLNFRVWADKRFGLSVD